ncbi:MAG: hypothetical protein QXP84_08125 [Candidatus Korarchaeum sp.]
MPRIVVALLVLLPALFIITALASPDVSIMPAVDEELHEVELASHKEYKVTFRAEGAGKAPQVCYTAGSQSGCETTPFTIKVRKGTRVDYTYQSVVLDEPYKYVLDSVSPSSPIVVNHDTTVVGRYHTELFEYKVTFRAEGAGKAPEVCYTAGSQSGCATTPFSITVPYGTEVSFSYQGIVEDGQTRYVLDSVSPDSPITVGNDVTVYGRYHTEHYLTVSSRYGNPRPSSGWYVEGEEITVSVESVVFGYKVKHICVGFRGTGSAPSGSSNTVTFRIEKPSSVEFLWRDEYLVSFDANIRAEVVINEKEERTPAEFWAKPGDRFTFSYSDIVFDGFYWGLLDFVNEKSPITVREPTDVFARYHEFPLYTTVSTAHLREPVKLYLFYVAEPGTPVKLTVNAPDFRIVSEKLYDWATIEYQGLCKLGKLIQTFRISESIEAAVPPTKVAVFEITLLPEKLGTRTVTINMNDLVVEIKYVISP